MVCFLPVKCKWIPISVHYYSIFIRKMIWSCPLCSSSHTMFEAFFFFSIWYFVLSIVVLVIMLIMGMRPHNFLTLSFVCYMKQLLFFEWFFFLLFIPLADTRAQTQWKWKHKFSCISHLGLCTFRYNIYRQFAFDVFIVSFKKKMGKKNRPKTVFIRKGFCFSF